jgi:hypothetical protein
MSTNRQDPRAPRHERSAAVRKYGSEVLGCLYTELSTRFHHEKQKIARS